LSRPARICLVGFMGSGKSTVGPILAGQLGYGFIDADEEIEARARAPIDRIFREQGEAAFRDLETRIIADLLGRDRWVIAAGGGAFAHPSCAEDILARSFTVHLHCEFDEAFRRGVLAGGRPLLAGGEASARALYAGRKDKYSRAHVTIDTTRRSPEEVVSEIVRLHPHP
jgi:shikimate kinase